MMTRFSASAWSTALIDFSRDTDSGTMMNGKITRSLSGSTGRTSGILIASSFAASFASVMDSLSLPHWTAVIPSREDGEESPAHGRFSHIRRGSFAVFAAQDDKSLQWLFLSFTSIDST